MCASTAYLRIAGGERVLMKEVAAIRPEGGKLVLTSLLGERLEADAAVVELDLLAHRIVLEGRALGRRIVLDGPAPDPARG